jgi:hypothetical protein
MNDRKIRLYLNMAQCGGTLFSKCIGCMEGVMLLSEIHPLGSGTYNPITQASRWYELFSEADKQALAAQGEELSYLDAIDAIYPLAAARGKTLVLRDWSHLDFNGIPFSDDPPGYSTHLELLRTKFDVVAAATVRHPVAQWLSLARRLKQNCDVPLGPFLSGYRKFAELAAEVGFVRYEALVDNPDRTLEKLCGNLDIPFDRTYDERWAANGHVTGDSSVEREIRNDNPLPGYPASVILEFEKSPDYRPALSLLGYKPAMAA